MNKLFTKIAALALGATMAVGVGVAVASNSKAAEPVDAASSYTITFNGTASESTSLSTSTDVSTITGSSSYVTGKLVTATKVYGATSDGVKLGASSNSGVLKFNLSASGQVTPTSIVVNCKLYNSGKSATLKVNGSATQSVPASSGNLTYSITSAITYLEFTSSKYIWVKSVTVNYNTGTKLATPTGLSASGSTLTWTRVPNNSGYAYSINTNPATTGNIATNTESFDASTLSLAAGDYTFQVKARGDGSNYSDSDYCTAVPFTISGGGGGGGDALIITPEYLDLDTTGIQSETTLTATDGMKYKAAAGGSNYVKKTAGIGDKAYDTSSKAIQIGKSGAYLYNNDAFDNPISTFKIYSNSGASTNVSVAVEFSTSKIDTAISSDTTHKSTLSTTNTADYDFTYSDMSAGYTFFRLQIMNAYNAQIQIEITFVEPSTDPEISISTSSTSITWDGTASQTILFTATTTNFSDDAEDIAYEWRSNNTNAISVTSVGSESTANLKVVGAGSAEITCYALGLSGDEATSTGVTVTVTNETYSGTLTITTSGDILTESEGEIEYTLTGNTHPMNTYNITSSDDNVIAVNYNSSTNKFEYLAGDTPDDTATVTITLSSSVYTLESYTANLAVHLVDSNSVASVDTNIKTRNVKFGGSTLSFTATVTLVSGATATDKEVSWTPVDPGVCTITPSANTLVGTVNPVNVGSTTVRVASVDDPTKYVDVTVNVSGPDSKTLNSITINKGTGYKQNYYDDDVNVDLTGLSLTANYVNSLYPTYSENINVANDASGVTWTLDLTNEKVKVAYTVDGTTVRDEFAITVTKAPSVAHFVAANLGLSDQTSAVGDHVISPFTFTFAQSTGANPPKYYSNGSSVRMYGDNYLTISSNETVDSIDEIIITVHDSKTSYTVETNTGGTYSGSTLDLTFTNTTEVTFTAGSNQFRPVTIDVYYTKVEAQDKDVESVSVSPTSATIETGKTTELVATVLPGDARDTSVTWASEDESIATVDEFGVVTGVSAGDVTITATSNDQPSISDSATIHVVAGPIVEFNHSGAIEDESGSQVYLGNAFFGLTVSGSSYRGIGDARGAQFSSGTDAVSVGLELTDIAVATQDLRVIVDAARNKNGTATLGIKLGTTDLECDSETTATLTNESSEYEFTYSGSASSTVSLSNLISINLSNSGGAIYLKSIKVYSAASKSVIGNFCTESLRMESYDVGGTQGSTGGNGSCKTWWNDVISAYNGLSAGQKYLFNNEDEYANARLRLSEWARINGYSYDSTAGTISESAKINPIAIINSKTDVNVVAIVAITSVISLTAIGGYFFLRKRREQN